jgi:hypothetical protein
VPRRLVVLNAALFAVAIVSVGYVIREIRTPAPAPARRPAPPPPPATTSMPAAPEASAGGYAVVASRNLFSPSRTEAPVASTAGAASAPKPTLYGIVLRDGAPVAYLEDPTTKRVAGYRVGDNITGGTVKQIRADHVVLNRPEGEVNVRLRDPSKPRPVAALAPAPATPGTLPTPAAPQPSGQAVAPPPVPGTPLVLPRRPLPPNLLRRLPPAATDAQPSN